MTREPVEEVFIEDWLSQSNDGPSGLWPLMLIAPNIFTCHLSPARKAKTYSILAWSLSFIWSFALQAVKVTQWLTCCSGKSSSDQNEGLFHISECIPVSLKPMCLQLGNSLIKSNQMSFSIDPSGFSPKVASFLLFPFFWKNGIYVWFMAAWQLQCFISSFWKNCHAQGEWKHSSMVDAEHF